MHDVFRSVVAKREPRSCNWGDKALEKDAALLYR